MEKKIFRFALPIFTSREELPSSIVKYVEARKHHHFKPHKTSFLLEENRRVLLVQELPFAWGFQPALREQVVKFWELGKKCHHLLMEIAIEEAYEGAFRLDNDFS